MRLFIKYRLQINKNARKNNGASVRELRIKKAKRAGGVMDNRTDKIKRKKKILDDGLCDVCYLWECPDSKHTKPKRNNGKKPRYKNKR